MNFLKNYKIKLTTLGPLYIGSGKTIGKKDYIYKKNENRFYFLNMKIFFKELMKRNLLKSFEDYMMGFKTIDLGQWLETQKITKEEWVHWVDYSVDAGFLEKKKKRMIDTFIKDMYGNPYIPGSSLKGALRTILLPFMMSKAEKKQTKRNLLKNEIRTEDDYEKVNKGIQNDYFNRLKREDYKNNATNDIMSMIRISDSGSLKKEDLIICQKIEKNVDGDYNILPTNRECIRPGVVIEFTLTLDTVYFPCTIEEIESSIKDFYRNYQEKFVDAFDEPDHSKDCKLYLGGGVGYVSKTLPYQIMEIEEGTEYIANMFKNTLDNFIYKKHKHDLDIHDYQVSPHIMKFGSYQRKRLQMGLCKWEVL